MNNRVIRILVAIIISPLIGALLTFFNTIMIPIASLPLNYSLNKTGLDFFIFLIGASYIFMGIPSILYSFIMEFHINKKVKNSFIAIILSMVIGGLFGMFIQLMTVGLLTGFIVGWILRIMYLHTCIK